MHGLQLPGRYDIELLNTEHKDYAVNSGVLDNTASQGLPDID